MTLTVTGSDYLTDRKTARQFSSGKPSLQWVSDLLRAAFGINRPAGQRTAPSAVNWREIDVYAASPDGLFVCDAKANILQPLLAIKAPQKELGFRRPSRREMQIMTEEQRARMEKLMAAFQGRMKEVDVKYPTADIGTCEDHIDHAVKIAGVDHVGVGTDFDGGGGIRGCNDHSEAMNVIIGLVRRGYAEKDIMKIWGANRLRVWRDADKVASRSGTAS
jgi:hypothetical protein